MQQQDAVGPLRQPQTHVCHVEFGQIALGAKCEASLHRNPGNSASTSEK